MTGVKEAVDPAVFFLFVVNFQDMMKRRKMRRRTTARTEGINKNINTPALLRACIVTPPSPL
jgi:hypothetical protein